MRLRWCRASLELEPWNSLRPRLSLRCFAATRGVALPSLGFALRAFIILGVVFFLRGLTHRWLMRLNLPSQSPLMALPFLWFLGLRGICSGMGCWSFNSCRVKGTKETAKVKESCQKAGFDFSPQVMTSDEDLCRSAQGRKGSCVADLFCAATSDARPCLKHTDHFFTPG